MEAACREHSGEMHLGGNNNKAQTTNIGVKNTWAREEKNRLMCIEKNTHTKEFCCFLTASTTAASATCRYM